MRITTSVEWRNSRSVRIRVESVESPTGYEVARTTLLGCLIVPKETEGLIVERLEGPHDIDELELVEQQRDAARAELGKALGRVAKLELAGRQVTAKLATLLRQAEKLEERAERALGPR